MVGDRAPPLLYNVRCRSAHNCVRAAAVPCLNPHATQYCHAGPSGDAAVQMLQQPLAFLEGVRREHGGVAGLLLGGERAVLVAGAHPAAVLRCRGARCGAAASLVVGLPPGCCWSIRLVPPNMSHLRVPARDALPSL